MIFSFDQPDDLTLDNVQEQMRQTTILPHHTALHRHVRSLVEEPVQYVELGVSGGASLKLWSELLTDRGSRIFGFDCWEGNPEDWGPYPKGSFASDPPDFSDDLRVELHSGLIHLTVGPWARATDCWEQIDVLHCDCDLWSSTLAGLCSLNPKIGPDTLIVFDELMIYPEQEWRALRDWTLAFYRRWQVVASSEGQRVVVEVIE